MSVLVGFASAQGSTPGIALEIADRLLKVGYKAIVRPMTEVEGVSQYEAVVLGSGTYDQAWPPQALEFLAKHEAELAKRPVWLFSVNSVAESRGLPGQRVTRLVRNVCAANPAQAKVFARIRPRDHHRFAVPNERGDMRRAFDFLLKLCGGTASDFGSFRDVDDWVFGITRDLQAIDRARERRRLHLTVRGKP